MKFDPNHAYICSGYISYITSVHGDVVSLYSDGFFGEGGINFSNVPFNELRRIPFHDKKNLITRSAVEGLLKSLDIISNGDDRCGSDLKAVAKEALKTFKETIGE